MLEEHPNFPHRKNNDSSFDSICPRCFRTISTRGIEGDLAQDERSHLCAGDSLGQRIQAERIHSSDLSCLSRYDKTA
jgi:hypothetical protein